MVIASRGTWSLIALLPAVLRGTLYRRTRPIWRPDVGHPSRRRASATSARQVRSRRPPRDASRRVQSHTSRSVSPPVTNRVPGRWTRRSNDGKRLADAPARLAPVGPGRQIAHHDRRSQLGWNRGDLRAAHRMVAADQRQDRRRQSGTGHRPAAGERAGKAAGAAPQHASGQAAPLGHDGIEVGVGLGIAHMRHDAMRAQFGRQIDAGVAPAIAAGAQAVCRCE